MIIKLQGSIKSDEEKSIDYAWLGVESGISFKDLDEALAAKPADDSEIILKIHCNGGSCVEGYAMYDRLRSMEGCTVKAEVEGECSSMATILLLAASERKAQKNARICIHKPRLLWYGEEVTEDDAKALYDQLHDETERMMSIYTERTGASRDDLEALMKEDRYITTDKAKELGFISDIIEPVTALKKSGVSKNSQSKKPNTMSRQKKEPTKAQRLFIALAASLGLKAEVNEGGEDEPKAMTLNTEDGSTITVEREEGEPQVGDNASPDGEWKMPDGKTIVIADGIITEIREPEGEGGEGEETESLKAEIAEKDKRIAELEAQLAESGKSSKTDAEKEILNLVAVAGGVEWLKSAKSSYKAPSRQAATPQHDETSLVAEELKRMRGQ